MPNDCHLPNTVGKGSRNSPLCKCKPRLEIPQNNEVVTRANSLAQPAVISWKESPVCPVWRLLRYYILEEGLSGNSSPDGMRVVIIWESCSADIWYYKSSLELWSISTAFYEMAHWILALIMGALGKSWNRYWNDCTGTNCKVKHKSESRIWKIMTDIELNS